MATKKCDDCGKTVSTRASKCPHCGAPVNPVLSPKVLRSLVIGGAIMIFGIAGVVAVKQLQAPASSGVASVQRQARTSTSAATSDEGMAPYLKLESWQQTYRAESGGTVITGVIRNTADRELRYAGIEFNVYNSSGNQIGKVWDSMHGLDAGAVWEFRTAALPTEAADVKFRKIFGR